MAAQQRKLLERLMGSSDGPLQIDFSDGKLCKAYCVDFCVPELFSGTKANLGRCPYVHIERARMVYRSRESKIPSFEREFERELFNAAASVEQRVAAAEQALQAEGSEKPSVSRLRQDIEDLCSEATAAGRSGQITSGTMAKVEELQAKRLELKKLEASDTQANQKLQVCQVCASLLSPAESDKRLADHFNGKIHRAYAQVFDAMSERHLVRKHPPKSS